MIRYALAALLALAPVTAANALETGWLSGSEYQSAFTRAAENGWWPVDVEADFIHGRVLFRAEFDPRPVGTGFYAHHGLSDAAFAARDAELRAQGYRRVLHQRIAPIDRAYNQGVWRR